MAGPNKTDRWAAAAYVASLVVPSGLIMFFDDTSIPSGWTRFSAPDGKRIVGAGSTYAVADTGGATVLTLSHASDSVGSHNGSPDCVTRGGTTQLSGSNISAVFGNHSHTFTAAEANLEPTYKQLVLIKADADGSELPQNTLVLWGETGTSPAGLTQQHTGETDNLIRAGATIDTGGTLTIANVSGNSQGSHTHYNLNLNAGGYSGGPGAGSHSHSTVTMTFTFNEKRVLLGLWKHASAAFNLEANMIGMYENTTPPDGWYLCDGNNGTPDMRDYFIAASDQANQGTSAGDNTFTCTHPSDSWTHAHCAAAARQDGATGTSHTSKSAAHEHIISFTDADYLPSYYSLAFIMYGG